MSNPIRKNPEVIKAISLTIVRGTGKNSRSPIREVVQLFTLEGEYLGENDPIICDICRNCDGVIIGGCGSDHK